MTATIASAGCARTRAAAKRGGSAPASQAAAAAPASRSRATPCWRRSDSNHPTLADAVDRRAPARRAPWWTRPTSGRCRLAAAARDRPDACGRTKGPSARRARTAPTARLIEFSIGTNSLNRAAVPAVAPHRPISQTTKIAERRSERTAYLCQLRRFFGRPSRHRRRGGGPPSLGHIQ
jgi:hypothetical protein